MGGSVKIGDFGLLRILKTTLTEHTGSLTLAYAAPEFLKGSTARTSDQYSLAVTYCHLRGGRLPFVGNPGQVMDGHLKNLPDLTMIPEAERGPVARALEKDHRRWPTWLFRCTTLAKLQDGKTPSLTPSTSTMEVEQAFVDWLFDHCMCDAFRRVSHQWSFTPQTSRHFRKCSDPATLLRT